MSTHPVAKPSLSPYLTENLESKKTKFHRISIAYQALNVITWVAISAIMVSIFAVAYSGVALTGGAAFATFVAMISTIPLLDLAIRAKNQSRAYGDRASLEGRVITQLKIDNQWTNAEIAAFLREEMPEEIEPKVPLRSLLPLIARYKVVRHEGSQFYAQVQQKMTDSSPDPAIRHEEREQGWRQLEQEAVPMLINGAILLQIIQKPELQFQVNHPQPSLSYSKIGLCRPKPPLQRILERNLDPKDDKYFYFFEKWMGNKTPLNLQEFEDGPTPNAIRLKLFGPSRQTIK